MAIVVALYLMIPHGVSAGEGQPAVQAEVEKMLRDDLDLEQVAVALAGSEVTLTGPVATFWDKNEAINRTLALDGVETVASELTIPGAEDDAGIAEEVVEAIRTYRFITIWDYVGGGVIDGVVTLNGTVTPDRDKSGDLFERVAKIPGVQDVQMRIVQQSASRRDNDLRRGIAARALRHPALSHYTLVADVPPFRIVVDQAVVTLVGAVRSGVESNILESITRQSFETREVVNLLQYPQ
tara:strand:- start:5136 stop:5852 length:717 start_codon:yes stop_codon:yes gene_type:complete